ncbi:MAG: glycosyltransferase family 4 protein [Candidatus Eremiobacteraeota bacterium]|nr:glycosyltransferase family 4 protein [Candidatus Eremiobacteraeota bacterium]
MRVLVLTQYYLPEIGAPQTRLAAFARELRVRGHDVEVVTAMPNHLTGRVHDEYRGHVYMSEEIDGVKVHRTWVYAATGTGVKRVLNYLSFACSCLIGLAKAGPADIVFVESPPLFLSVPGWMAARARRAGMVFNVSDLWPDSVRELGVMSDGFVMRLAEMLEAWSYRRASVVNAVTEGIATTLRDHKQVPSEKVRFLPNGIDIDTFVPRDGSVRLARELQLTSRPVFIYAGTHGIAQALDSVLTAAKLVEDEADVVFVGSGPVKSALVERAGNEGIRNVRFVDPVPLSAMPEYFSLATASIVPLVNNPLMRGARPSKMFPSLACGVPILYCGEGESATLISEAGAGLVAEPENARAIADAMRTIANDPARREVMSRRARRLAVERFAWGSIVEEWLRSMEASPHRARAHTATMR